MIEFEGLGRKERLFMQKKWFKNAIVFVLTLMMIFGNVTPQRVQAASDSDRYTGGLQH